MKKKGLEFLFLLVLIQLSISISGCSNSKVEPQLSIPPSPQADTKSADCTPGSDSNLIQESSSANWVFHQENAINSHGEMYTKEAYIMQKDSKYTFYFIGHPKGVGSFTGNEFIYEIFGIEYHYPLTTPITEPQILFDLDKDGKKESLQDDGIEIFVKKEGGGKLLVHQISDIARGEGNFFYAPVPVNGLVGYAIVVVDPGANGFDTVHVYHYSMDSETFNNLPFEYPDGEKKQVFWGHVRRTESGGLEGITREPNSESNWVVTFYDIVYQSGALKVKEKYKESGGWPIWWTF